MNADIVWLMHDEGIASSPYRILIQKPDGAVNRFPLGPDVVTIGAARAAVEKSGYKPTHICEASIL